MQVISIKTNGHTGFFSTDDLPGKFQEKVRLAGRRVGCVLPDGAWGSDCGGRHELDAAVPFEVDWLPGAATG